MGAPLPDFRQVNQEQENESNAKAIAIALCVVVVVLLLFFLFSDSSKNQPESKSNVKPNVDNFRVLKPPANTDTQFGDDEDDWHDMSLEELGNLYRRLLASCQISPNDDCKQKLGRLLDHIYYRLWLGDEKTTLRLKVLIETISKGSEIPVEIYIGECSDGFTDQLWTVIYWIEETDNPEIFPEDAVCKIWIKIKVVQDTPKIIQRSKMLKETLKNFEKWLEQVYGENLAKQLKEAPIRIIGK